MYCPATLTVTCCTEYRRDMWLGLCFVVDCVNSRHARGQVQGFLVGAILWIKSKKSLYRILHVHLLNLIHYNLGWFMPLHVRECYLSSISSFLSLPSWEWMGNGISREVCRTHCTVMKWLIFVIQGWFNVATPLTTVYDRHGYRDVVERVTNESMQKAVEEVKRREDYDSCWEVMIIYLLMQVAIITCY